MVCEWFDLKTNRTIFFVLALKPVTTVFFGLASKLVATVSLGLVSKPVVGFLVEHQNQCGEGILGLELKIGSYDLVICASKLPRQFLGLSLKTKHNLICRLCHKNNGRATAWDTR
jgi:hypothetical protein